MLARDLLSVVCGGGEGVVLGGSCYAGDGGVADQG